MLSAVLASGRTYQVTLGDFGDETTMGPRLSWPMVHFAHFRKVNVSARRRLRSALQKAGRWARLCAFLRARLRYQPWLRALRGNGLAGVFVTIVPAAHPSPIAPFQELVFLAERISRVPGIANGRGGWMAGLCFLRHHRSRKQRRNNQRGAKKPEFRHATLLLVPVTQRTKCGRERRFRFLKIIDSAGPAGQPCAGPRGASVPARLQNEVPCVRYGTHWKRESPYIGIAVSRHILPVTWARREWRAFLLC